MNKNNLRNEITVRLTARVTNLKEQLDDIQNAYDKVINETCPTDEKHCTCVPFLRMRVEELEDEIEEHNQLITLQNKRSIEASRLWQAANGLERDSIWPDLGELLQWMMDRIEQLERKEIGKYHDTDEYYQIEQLESET